MTDNLRHKTMSALLWSFLERFGQQGIQFVIGIILARLLLPEEFGLIAMLTIFMAVAQSFIDSGFGQALIQKQSADHVDECSIFYFNILVGCVAAGLLCLAAPYISSFYNQPILELLTCALSLNLIINAFGLVQTALLTKTLDFKTQTMVSVFSMIVTGAVGITMAFYGFGVWSLVAQSVGGNLMRVVLLWFCSDWRPAWLFSVASLRSMFRFGSKLLASGLLDTVFRNLYLIVIGKVFSAGDLGFYSRARQLQHLPVDSLSSVVGRVTFPVFSSVQSDKARLKRGVKQALGVLMFVNAPLMVGLAVTAEPLVLVLLTEKWLPCVPYLQLFCVIGLLYPAHTVNLNVLKAQGRSDLFLRLEVIKKLMMIAVIALTYRFGITVMLYGQICTSVVGYLINSYYTKKFIEYSVVEQVKDFVPQVLVAVAMGMSVFGLTFLGLESALVLLISQIGAGVILYIGFAWLTKNQSFVACRTQIFEARRGD
ncbi:MAG: flippase [Desulfuromonas sp.]|nr:MAG: flippase [Desulfuromonas sp.]